MKQDKNIYKLTIDIDEKFKGKLDEMLEGSMSWWINDKNNSNSTGQAEVLSVIPENCEVILRFLTGEKPIMKTIITIYPKIFIESSEKVWSIEENAIKALNWLNKIDNLNENLNDIKVDTDKISIKHNWLREK